MDTHRADFSLGSEHRGGSGWSLGMCWRRFDALEATRATKSAILTRAYLALETFNGDSGLGQISVQRLVGALIALQIDLYGPQPM